MTDSSALPLRHFAQLRDALREGREVALIDLREEAAFATGHPLFAANLALSKLELEILDRVPNRRTAITLYDNGEFYDQQRGQRKTTRAAALLTSLGYQDIALLAGDLAGWKEAGGEIFIDVNAPSKAFGEWVEHHYDTPSLSAEQVLALQQQGANLAVLDVRRFDEFQAMSIPGGVSVPGGELVLRLKDVVPDPNAQIIVNCAGRTRSIIGTQSLINAGVKQPVAALRNGTIGWTLAGQALSHLQHKQFPALSEDSRRIAMKGAQALGIRAGVRSVTLSQIADWQQDTSRTLYLFDVRTAEEFRAGHLSGARHVPGGQLVQETDHYATVRGARVVLADNDGVRARMAASWLAQMNWEVYIAETGTEDFTQTGDWKAQVAPAPAVESVKPEQLLSWLSDGKTGVIDLTTSANFRNRRIPGAIWTTRGNIPQVIASQPEKERWVVTCTSGLLARYAVTEVAALTGKTVYLLEKGTVGWIDNGLLLERGDSPYLDNAQDRYRRPYEGTDVSPQAMQDYLDWEYGLVAQLEKDGTHGFRLLEG
ncbi:MULTISPECIES: rhodanese-like domain-containing protein [Rahnella]|jgi:rhodanese-related sulfurtransferase|uniref:rhodanese-like domain-containing protein n=1 Tax=Rahnella TaxID=34037 RepID=UPI00103E37EE|nr:MULTISPECIES: rhodanese-like domain-containing protein [Rahnella]TBX37102.1 rhodanese-related sulfurtransferase [Rahnella victoriana]TDS88090.1 rhodanese-related sulfurtransferase [Rahnella sp. BIGb0236]UHM90247.1 rhodanese-related sulfurtransferase [Rahnella victoriana]